MEPCILLRYGEIGLKSSRTRGHFEQLYVKAIEDALRKQGVKQWKLKNYGGGFVLFSPEPGKNIDILQRLPGIQSFSVAKYCSFADKKDVLEKVQAYAASLIAGKTFCVRVRRVGNHPFTSQELEQEAGAVLYPHSAGVQLQKPEVLLSLEVRGQDAFFSTETIFGLGGLPPTSSGKVLLLFSGGIDSPVAAYHLIKRGCQVDFLFINLLEEKALNDVARVYNYLISQYAFGYTPRCFVVPARRLVEKIREVVPQRLRQLALKTCFYKIGEQIAKKTGALAIATGEALSQKSTQTLESLQFLEQVKTLPVLRPLLSLDKIEITQLAQKIGTLAASEKVKEYCNLSEGPVVTKPNMALLQKIPDLTTEIQEAVTAQQPFTGFLPFAEEEPIAFSGEPGQELICVDVRPQHQQDVAPLPTTMSRPYPFVLEELDTFEKNKHYLFICDFGVQSEQVAFLLRKKGMAAAGISVPHFLKYFQKQLHGSKQQEDK